MRKHEAVPEPVAHATGLLRRFPDLSIAVVGDVIYDAYLDGVARRLCREGPVPVVDVSEHRDAAGGAANAAVNLAALGARVELYAAVGDDDAGRRALEISRAAGVRTDGVLVSRRRRTCAKRRVVADGQILVRYDEGTPAPLESDEAGGLLGGLTAALGRVDAVVLSDYGNGIVSDDVIGALSRAPCPPVIVDGRDPARFRHLRPALCAPSYAEVAALTGTSGTTDRAGRVAEAGTRILAATGADCALVTLDRDGAVVLERGRPPRHVAGRRVDERSAAGAGDTFTAAATLAFVAGGDATTAAHVAAAAAEVVVAKPGTAACSLAELRLRLLSQGKLVPDVERLGEIGRGHRREARRIVLANGCFDVLHTGHVSLLERAKGLGDVLVVAVNSDASVRRLKGRGRPVNALEDRMEILAALSCVDHLVAFDEDRPLELISALQPDVLAKGGDYTADGVPEAPLVRELGGRVQILDLVPDRSTTRTIQRLALAGP
jgi:D-beta-D-heptose 7-phosphate kinase/D-beta-D-heptose 1-phosphate adenosyltransferase